MHFLIWRKGSYQSPNFDTFKCSGENLPNSSFRFPNHKLVFIQILHHSSVSCKITPLYFFRSNVIYFAQKEPIKVQMFRVIFETTNQFFFILHHSSVSWHITYLYFFSRNFINFQQKEPIKVQIQMKIQIWWNFTRAV